jgi:hypothetical protein
MKWFEEKDQLAKKSIGQIYSNGLEFAVASPREQCSHFIYCKDFLHDAVWANLYNTAVEIHGFKYDPKVSPIDVEDLTRVLVANESDEFFDKKIPNCLEFLNKVEKHLHLKRTVAYQCENPPEDYLPGGVFLLEGSQRWMSAPPMLSMYTMFIRCGFVHKTGDDFMTTLNKIATGETPPYQGNDESFVKSSLPGIKAIMSLGYRKVFYKDMKRNYPQNITTSTLHHDCGIRAYSWGYTKNTVPYWHRDALLGILKERGVEIENLWRIPPPPPLPPVTPGAFINVMNGKWVPPSDGPVISKDMKTEMKEANEKNPDLKHMVKSAPSPKNWNW